MMKTSAGIFEELIEARTYQPWRCNVINILIYTRAYELACIRAGVALTSQHSVSPFFDHMEERLRNISGCRSTVGIDSLYIGGFGRERAMEVLRGDWISWRDRNGPVLEIEAPVSIARVNVGDVVRAVFANGMLLIGAQEYGRVESYIRGYLKINEESGQSAHVTELDELGKEFKEGAGLSWIERNDLFDVVLIDCHCDETRALRRLEDLFRRAGFIPKSAVEK